VCWSIVVQEKPTGGSPFFGAFPSDLIPKATKYVSAYCFFRIAVLVNDTSEFRECFEATTYNFMIIIN
jgi:hypothetical protein